MDDLDGAVHRCDDPTCAVDWLFDPAGPSDPAWRARIRAELTKAGSALRGRAKSAVTRARISAALVGNTRASGNRGRRLSAEHRQAISAGQRRRISEMLNGNHFTGGPS